MKLLFVIPGDIDQPTGGYRYDRNIIRHLANHGVTTRVLSLVGSYPFPSRQERESALEAVANVGDSDITVVDGLAGGALPKAMERLAMGNPVVSLIHHPLHLETGLNENQRQELFASEKDGLQFVSGVITTSPQTSRAVRDQFEYPGSSITAIVPGVDRPGFSSGSEGSALNLVCVGSLIERKGHLTLLKALASLKQHDWHLHCAGKSDLDLSLTARLNTFAENNGLADRVTFLGAVTEDKLEQLYSESDLFVLPSRYEGYGMAYVEAIVRGIPVVGTTAGAIPQTVPAECGILVEPENTGELAKALDRLFCDSTLLKSLKLAAQEASTQFPDWNTSARDFAKALREFL